MAYLLFECLSEEVPAKMQQHAVTYTKKAMATQLQKHEIDYNDLKIFTTPQRLVIYIEGISALQEEKLVEIKGPRVNAPEISINGFLQKNKKNKEDLHIKSTSKGDFYFLSYKVGAQTIQTKLHTTLEDLLMNFEWPKSMRWGNGRVKWIRPIKSLLCLFNDNILPIEFAGLKASNFTHGHRFKSSALEIFNATDYFTKLKENYVIIDQEERFKFIKEQAVELAEDNDLHLNIDQQLLEEITGLVEYPTVLLGKIDNHFMSLPSELLIAVMRNHQKYHYLLDQNMEIAPFFVLVSNNGNNEEVVKGNEKVLRARFSDAKFLIDQDLQNSLESYTEKLNNIVFHSKLGFY